MSIPAAGKGKTVLLTGGAKGLGRFLTSTLADDGYQVVFSYLSSGEEARQLVQEVKSRGGAAHAVQADVSDYGQLRSLVEEARSIYGPIDVLINNAGPFTRARRRFADYTHEEIQYLIGSNLTAALELDSLVLRDMRSRGFGRIIHFGFAHAGESRAWPHRAVYAAAKSGLVSFTKTLAVEEAEYGITVNMICPADIKGLNKHKTIAEVQDDIDVESPRLRPGAGEDVARVVKFLLQPESDFITGAIIDVSGGMDPIRTWPLNDG